MVSAGPGGRRFTLLDAMILVAATAAGSAWLASIGLTYGEVRGAVHDAIRRPSLDAIESILALVAGLLTPGLSAWTLAWIVIRLRGPRPAWRRLMRQPGAMVAIAATLGWGVGGLTTLRLGSVMHHSPWGWMELLLAECAVATMLGGFGVLVTWTGSALAGGWRPERTWVDCLGRTLGLAWMTLSWPSGLALDLLPI